MAKVNQTFHPSGRFSAGKFLVTLEVQVSLLVSNREQITDLGANAENAGPESAEERGRAKIVGNLLISVSDQSGEHLLGQKVRRAPVKMEVDAILILRGRVLEIVGEAGNAGEFDSRRRVEVGIAGAEVDAAMPDADVGQACGVVGADRNIAETVDHVIVDALIPFQRHQGIEITEARDRIRQHPVAGHDSGTDLCGQRTGDAGVQVADSANDADGKLAAEHGRREGVGRRKEHKIAAGIQIGVEIDVRRRRDLADLDLARCRNVAGSSHAGVIAHHAERPSRHRRSGSKASELARKPEGHAVFVRPRRLRVKRQRRRDDKCHPANIRGSDFHPNLSKPCQHPR